MSQRTISRSERRMGKKPAIMLLILVLAVSLISFSLGVMVGRSGAKQVARSVNQSIPSHPELTPPSPSPTQTQKLPAPAEPAPTEAVSAADGPTEKPAEKLTFYETLPRGDLPLGSGINLPPASTGNEAPPKGSAGETIVSGAVAAKQPAAKSGAPQIAAPAPLAVAKGAYVVQIASFKDVGGADQLKQKLDRKGYSLFIEPADLGSKGIWHRVFAGPYPNKTAAVEAAEQLKQQEKMAPLVRKR